MATSAACAVDIRIGAIQSTLTLRGNMVVSPYRNLHFHVGPTTVITEISGDFSGAVVYHHLKHVLTRLTEARGGRCLSAVELGPGRIKRNVSWTSILHPVHRHSDRFPVPDRPPVIGRDRK